MHLVEGECVSKEDTAGDTAGETAGPFPCGEESILTLDDPDAGYANPGTVFSSAEDLPEGHTPKALWVTVTEDGEPLVGCDVNFEIRDGNGWVFARPRTTDDQGRVKAYWTAGSQVGTQLAKAKITRRDGTIALASWEGTVTDTSSRTGSVYLNYQVPETFDGFRVRISPLTGPGATSYATIVWPGAYGGIQFKGDSSLVIFSTWDQEGADAEVVDSGVCNQVPDFEGEGGVSCRLLFPPSTHGSIPGLPEDYKLVPEHEYETLLEVQDCGTDCQDYSFSFTDHTRGFGPISLGTQRFHSDQVVNDASSFIEAWSANGNCTSSQRSALFYEVAARSGGAWENIDQAVFSPLYNPSNNEICANYDAQGSEDGFLMVSGGTGPVGWPSIDGDDDYPATRTVVIP